MINTHVHSMVMACVRAQILPEPHEGGASSGAVWADFRVSEQSMAVRTSASDEKSGSSDGTTPLGRCGRCIHTAVHTHLERMCCERIMVMV